MKKNDVFTFTAPNGVEVTAVVIGSIYQGSCVTALICYAQNRIFTYIEETFSKNEDGTWARSYSYGWEIVDHAILPDYDEMLARYNDIEVAQAETQSGSDMEHSREAIRTFIAYGFSEEEAINILDGKNPDGTEFIELPF